MSLPDSCAFVLAEFRFQLLEFLQKTCDSLLSFRLLVTNQLLKIMQPLCKALHPVLGRLYNSAKDILVTDIAGQASPNVHFEGFRSTMKLLLWENQIGYGARPVGIGTVQTDPAYSAHVSIYCRKMAIQELIPECAWITNNC